MANRNRGRQARKRRPAGARQAQPNAGALEADGKPAAAREPSKARRGADGKPAKTRRSPHSSPTAPTYGERPEAPWHPFPLSELLILVGAIAVVFGVRKGVANAGATLLAGLAAVAIGTFEVTLREHRSGFRSHTVMLALLPVLIFHSLTILAVSVFTTAPRLLNVGLFALDIALFVFLFRMLRARFLDARHARVLREG